MHMFGHSNVTHTITIKRMHESTMHLTVENTRLEEDVGGIFAGAATPTKWHPLRVMGRCGFLCPTSHASLLSHLEENAVRLNDFGAKLVTLLKP